MAISILFGSAFAHAQEVITLPVANDAINLSTIAQRYESADPNLQIEVLSADAKQREQLSVKALSQRVPYKWLTFTLANTTDKTIKPLIVVPRRGFVGTGLIWPNIGGQTVLSITASSGAEPERVLGRPGVFRLSVEPQRVVTYVVEINGNWPPRLGLWNERAYKFHLENRSLYRGFLLGLIGLISLYLTILFFVSRQMAYLSGALLSIAGTLLLLLEFGFFSPEYFSSPSTAVKLRSATEALMALGVFSFFHTFLLLRHRMPILGYLNIVMIVAMAILVPYAFFQPYYAAGVARISFAGGVFFGGMIILFLSARGNPRALAILPAWIVLAGWSLFVGSAIVGWIAHPLLSPGIAAGLILTLLLLAFVVTQFAVGTRMSKDSSGRDALALAGAGNSVWDYNLEQKSFYVSPEIEKLLGLRPGHFEMGGTHTWLDLMHKDDRDNFSNRLDAMISKGMGFLNLSFRMRGTDGGYRWLQLKARAVPGENNMASRCIGVVTDITHTKLAEERLLRDAVHDHLTGLPNQTLFADRLERAVNRYSEQSPYEIGLILVDIDRISSINDSLGHAAGDNFLLISARRIADEMSPRDTVAKISKNRFAILTTTQIGIDEVYQIAENIQNSISQPIPFRPRKINLTSYIGLAIYKSGTGEEATEFLKRAEIAMYSAKRRGNSNISVFDPRMSRRTTNRVALEADLHQAIERNEFKLMYQPIVHLSSGQIAGFEALIRWQHQTRGLLGPDEFMDIAEETGLIIDIGRFVLNEAGIQLGSWQRLYTTHEMLFMSVNVSTRQIIQPDMIGDLQAILDRSEITPGTLKIEVTETQVMENPELASRVLQRIRKFGAGLSLDDFGTGYSSLSYLQSFPFDTIKIDKSFVHSENRHPFSDIILKSVVSLAHDLGMAVVAEGVEEISEAEMLNELGCEFVQGFLYGEPMSARDAQKLLSHRLMSVGDDGPDTVFSRLSRLQLEGQASQPDYEIGSTTTSTTQSSQQTEQYQPEDAQYEEVADEEEYYEEDVAEEALTEKAAVEEVYEEEVYEEEVPQEEVPQEDIPQVEVPQEDTPQEEIPQEEVYEEEVVEEIEFDENILDGYIDEEEVEEVVETPVVEEIAPAAPVQRRPRKKAQKKTPAPAAKPAKPKSKPKKPEKTTPEKTTKAKTTKAKTQKVTKKPEPKTEKPPQPKPAVTKSADSQNGNQPKRPDQRRKFGRKKKRMQRRPGKKIS